MTRTPYASAAALIAVLLVPAAARADDDLRTWQRQTDEEPGPRYGPGGEREPKPSKRGATMLGIGVGLTALGGAGVVTAGLLAASCVVPESNCNKGPLAGGLVAGGLVGVLVGVPLIVMGNRQRKGVARSAPLRLHAVALPAGGGLGVSGSF